MKHIATVAVATLLTVSTFAQTTLHTSYKYLPAKILSNDSGCQTAVKKAASYPDIIFTQPEGTLLQDWSMYAEGYTATYDSFAEASYDGLVRDIVLGNNGEVYLKDPISSLLTKAWIKGVKAEGDTVEFQLPQKLCYAETDKGETFDCLAYRMVPAKVATDDGDMYTYVPDTTTQIVKYVMRNDSLAMVAEPDMIIGLGSAIDGEWIGYGDYANVTRQEKAPILAPANPDAAQDYILTHEVVVDDWDYKPVKVAVENDDIYIGGLDSDIPEAWVKGKLNGDKAVFEGFSYLGINAAHSEHHYFTPAGKKRVYVEIGGMQFPTDSLYLEDQLVFNYDAQTKTLATEGGMMINRGKVMVANTESYFNSTLSSWANKPGVPQAPVLTEFWPYEEAYGWGSVVFDASRYDVDGNYLNPDNLYYRLYMDSILYVFSPDLYFDFYEETTDVPYLLDATDFVVTGDNRAVYFYNGGFSVIGVQMVYIDPDDNNKRYESKIAWWGDDDASKVGNAPSAVMSISYTDLYGRKVAQPHHGIYLKTITLQNGEVKTKKVVIK